MIGNGYRLGYDIASAIGASDGLWGGVHNDIKVSFRLYICGIKLTWFSRHPDELYLNGIQRQSFIPAIELIKHRFGVVDLNSPTGKLSHRDLQDQSLLQADTLHRLPKDPPSPLQSLL